MFFTDDRQLPQSLWITFSAPSSESHWVKYIHLCHIVPSLCFCGCLSPPHLQWYTGVAGRRQNRHWELRSSQYHLVLGVSASRQHTQISERGLQKALPGWPSGLHRPHHSSPPPSRARSLLWLALGTSVGASLASYWNSEQCRRCTFFFIRIRFFLRYNYYSPLMELISIKPN